MYALCTRGWHDYMVRMVTRGKQSDAYVEIVLLDLKKLPMYLMQWFFINGFLYELFILLTFNL